MSNIHKAIEGIESSRRVGWAKYYELSDEVWQYRYTMKRLCESIIHNKRLRNDDDLVIIATEILRSLAEK